MLLLRAVELVLPFLEHLPQLVTLRACGMVKMSSAVGLDASLGDRPFEVIEVADLEASGDHRVVGGRQQGMVALEAAVADMSSQTRVRVSKTRERSDGLETYVICGRGRWIVALIMRWTVLRVRRRR